MRNKMQDALENNFKTVNASISRTIEDQKKQYDPIIEKYIDNGFRIGVQEAEKDLSLKANSLYDFDKTKKVRDILGANAITISYELFDAINKEITLMLTDIELNNIPFTNAGLKREIREIFANKSARLASQVTTETTRAVNQGLKWGYDKSGLVTHKQWVAVIDSRTSSICLMGNGQIREFGKPFSTGDYGAPFHINCRSRIQNVTLAIQ